MGDAQIINRDRKSRIRRGELNGNENIVARAHRGRTGQEDGVIAGFIAGAILARNQVAESSAVKVVINSDLVRYIHPLRSGPEVNPIQNPACSGSNPDHSPGGVGSIPDRGVASFFVIIIYFLVGIIILILNKNRGILPDPSRAISHPSVAAVRPGGSPGIPDQPGAGSARMNLGIVITCDHHGMIGLFGAGVIINLSCGKGLEIGVARINGRLNRADIVNRVFDLSHIIG